MSLGKLPAFGTRRKQPKPIVVAGNGNRLMCGIYRLASPTSGVCIYGNFSGMKVQATTVRRCFVFFLLYFSFFFSYASIKTGASPPPPPLPDLSLARKL